MKILVACEFSGVVRQAFAALGHDAWSCDLLPSEIPGQHFQCSVLDVLNEAKRNLDGTLRDWDLLIGFPPCTYLCNSGVRWLAPGGKLDLARHLKMQEACDFFAALYWADVPKVCIENPVMHKYARDYLASVHKINKHDHARPAQTIQPWQFGHGESKATCFWLRDLPLLQPTQIVSGRVPRVHHASPGVDRWKERSRTLPGIAKALAEQFGKL